MKRGTLPALFLALLCLTGCCGGSGEAKSLTLGLRAGHVDVPRAVSEEEAAALTEFSLELLRAGWKGENILVSPLSVLSALGMTANGAGGTTREQMEAVLGLPVEELNAALAAWTADLPKEKDCRINLANALWLRDDGSFAADPDFLQTVLDWYGPEVYGSQFDEAAVREVNAWVEKNTHGMIDGIVEEFSDAAMLCLVNALALEAEWETVYREDQVWDGRIFTTEDGTEQSVTMMYSSEGYYLEGEGAQGFLKPYRGGRWAFAALLPDEGVKLEDYAASLSGERLHGLLERAEETLVYAAIPKFESVYGAELNESLKAMGMPDAFEAGKADFSGMGNSPMGPLFISQVLHRTYLSVDEKGTRAGAVTAVIAESGSSMPGAVPEVHLDRPFLYMLVDRETNLPAFLGAVTDMS